MTTPEHVDVIQVNDGDVLELRAIVNDLVEPYLFSDQRLAEIIALTMDDDSDDVNMDRAAQHAYVLKASHYAELVNVSESGSSRNLSDLHKNALNMAKLFQDKLDKAAALARALAEKAEAAALAARGPVVNSIERP